MQGLLTPLFLVIVGFVSSGERPLPASHFPTKDEALELLRTLCPNDVDSSYRAGEESYGCKACPPFTSYAKDRVYTLQVQSVIYGHFTAPDRDEAVLSFAGCEGRDNSMGGSVLLRKSPDGWHRVDYLVGMRFWGNGLPRAHGAPSTGCQTYDLKDRRQLLLCEGFSMGQGYYESSVYTMDLAAPEADRYQELYQVSDGTNACGPMERDTWMVASIDRVEIQDLNNDGMPDVSVFAKMARVKVRELYENGCPKGWVAGDPKGGYLRDSPQVKTYRLDFLFDGTRFVLAPWSAKVKKLLDEM